MVMGMIVGDTAIVGVQQKLFFLSLPTVLPLIPYPGVHQELPCL